MRKRMSAAALGLRMTMGPGLLCILLTSALQVLEFMDTEWMWQTNLFEMVLDTNAIDTIAGWSKYALMAAVMLPLIQMKTKHSYTLRRLRIGEGECYAIWSGVFSGYFLLSWAVQLGLVLWMWGAYSDSQPTTAMEFFLASHRSRYFHLLMPHGEPWAWVRNLALCLSYGTLTAHFPWMLQNKKVWLGAVALVLLAVLAPQAQAQMTLDILLCLTPAVIALGSYGARKWVAMDEN